MAFVPFPNCASVELIFTEDSQRIENRYHVEQDTPYDETSLAVLAALFATWWDDNIQPQVSNSVTLVSIIARALDTASSPAVEYTAGLPNNGAISVSPALPNHVTCAVKWTTGLRGRSFRGRTYHIGLVESQVNGNTIVASNVTELIAGYSDLLTDLEGLPGELVIASRIANGVERTTGLTTQVAGVFIDATVDSQRRRLPGRGR